jgi:TorA maturation chaperone TorD
MQRLILHDAVANWPYFADTCARKFGLQALGGFVTGWCDEQVEEVRREHDELFVGPGPQKVPPWGSVYLNEENLLVGASTRELEEFLRDRGIIYTRREIQPLDHIGLCFDALKTMLSALANETRDRRKGEEAVREFLALHFLTWAPRFVQLHMERARSGLQRGMAALACDFMETIAFMFQVEPAKRPLFI